jgi:large subunit ribosomal protein L15
MRLHDLHPSDGARHEPRRLGRGNASGRGTTAGKGTKGQKARSGGAKANFRGMSSRAFRYGKAPGFTNIFRVEYAIVKVSDLEAFDADAVVDADTLRAKGLIRGKKNRPVKLLSNGVVSKPLVVRLDKVTQVARQKLEAVGGRVEDAGNGSSST